MKSKLNKILTWSALILLLTGLGSCRDENSPEAIADDMCSCLLNTGFASVQAPGANKGGMPECARDLADRLKETLDEMNEDEKAEFTRELLKALLDTNCVDFMIKQMGHEQVMSFVFNFLGK